MAAKAKKRYVATVPPSTDAPSGSLQRGLRILEAVTEAARPLSSVEIAQRCGLDPSTTHRLLQTLAGAGYLLRDEPSRRYLASPKVLFPLPLYHPWNIVRRDAQPALTALRDQLGATVGVVAFCLGQRILLELAAGRDSLSPDYKTWLASPLHASGSGKVLLASLSPAERRQRLGAEPYEKFTDRTATTARALDREIDESMARGYVLACDDYIRGFRVAAAPIRATDGGIVGCFFSSGRASGFPDERLHEIGKAIWQTADLFSRMTPSLRGIAEFLGRGSQA